MIILIACGMVIVVLAWEVNHPHTVTAPVIKTGRIDSSQVITPGAPTIRRGDSIKIRDSVVLRFHDTTVWRFRDSVGVRESTIVHNKDTIRDTSFHFYGIGGRDERGDSAYIEMGSSLFPATRPADLDYNFAFYPAPDTIKKYRQTDTLVRTIHSGWGWAITGGLNYGYRPDVGKANAQVGIQVGYGYQFSK